VPPALSRPSGTLRLDRSLQTDALAEVQRQALVRKADQRFTVLLSVSPPYVARFDLRRRVYIWSS
jgi:hypothetical protein